MNEKDYINKMYDASQESEKAGLQQGYDQANAQLEEQQKKAQQQTDANLTRTYVEAAKAQKNYNEVQNAYGLTSGAMAQARLAQDNQLQGDLTTLRAAQQNIDAGIERERGTLAQQYAAAIQQAQANNDLARAQALFEAAQAEDARLNQKKANAANLMAGVGDYARLAELYGLTAEELALLMGKTGGGSAGSGGSGMSGGGGFGGGGTAGATGGSPVTEDDLLRQKMKQDYA
jgi:transcriptional regulator with GAF, ATPase, and Fis domain